MTPQRWSAIEELFNRVADLPPGARAPILDAADPTLSGDVRKLLAVAPEATGRLRDAVGGAQELVAQALEEDSKLEGARLGPYRVIREIGRGGMGAVYLASRDDDQYRKEVALKVVKRGMETAEVLARFRRERQVLANLDHRYIARLIDGGVTPGGLPFFVMEYVEGRPIDRYCREESLDTGARLELFRRVCEAVAYAHRTLVVHRDLKPGNILVTPQGAPKLLDFGVAKLLTERSVEDTGAPGSPGAEWTHTVAAAAPLTPDYASPEQFRGLPVTTATDVYALGAILYELLSGVRARDTASRTPAEIEWAVCEREPVRPSVAAREARFGRRLRGDLDNIVLMAMRREPERRYSSVDHLDDDIRRHLEGYPVHARQDSAAYRAGRFVRRNKLGIAAAGLVAVSLVGGAAVAVSQARRAEAARAVAETERTRASGQARIALAEQAHATEQAQLARIEQNRSEHRLAQMVELADRSLYDVHSAIERLPGATDARRQIVVTTLQFLEDLSKDAGQDSHLLLVLSAAYRKVADIQGYPARPNLGDSAGAQVNYTKAIELMKPLLAVSPENPDYLLEKVSAESHLCALLAWTGPVQQAVVMGRAALPEAQLLARLRPGDLRFRRLEPEILESVAFALRRSDAAGSLEYVRRQTAVLDVLLKLFPTAGDLKLTLASAYSQEASLLGSVGRLPEAVARFRQSITLREAYLEQVPTDVVARRGLMISYGNLGFRLGSPLGLSLGDVAGAREYYGKALSIARDLAKADRSDRLAQSDLASALVYYGVLDVPKTGLAESLAVLREGASLALPLLAADPKSIGLAQTVSTAQEYAGRRLRELGLIEDALEEYRKSLATAERQLATNPSNLSMVGQALADEEAMAELLAARHDGPVALDLARKAVARAERVEPAESQRERMAQHIGEAYVTLGTVHAALQNWSEASAAAQRASGIFQHLIAVGSTYVFVTWAERAEALLQECRTHLQ